MSLLQNAAYGGIMILAVAVLRGALKDKLIPEARLALWAVCLFRLLTPAAPESVLSLWGLLGREARSAPVQTPAVVPNGMGTFVPPMPAGTAPAPVEAGIPWEMLLSGIWLVVGFALAARFALSYARTRRAVKCAIPLGRDDPRYALLPRRTRLREGTVDGAPLTFGAVRPTVVLTPGLDGEALACVLAHEGVHVRRRDNLWHYAMALALVVQWWNPAVWLMARLLRRDVELSCDRAAVKALGADKRAEYASTLVSMASAGADPAFCQTFGRKAAEERIISIMKFKKLTVIGAVLTLALVLAVTVGFASNPAERLPDEESTTSSAPAGRLPNEVSAYVEKLSVGMSRENVHILLGEPSFSMSSPFFSDTYELDDTHKPQVGIYYDVDSAVTQVKYFFDGTDPDAASIDLTPHLAGSAPAMISEYIFLTDDTVVFHGRAFNRADLSAETLEWLDWYLALTEEERLAVSFVPPELRDEPDYVVYSDTPRETFLAEYKDLLSRCVAEGTRDESEVDRMLDNLENAVAEADEGKIWDLMFNKNGDGGFFYGSMTENAEQPAGEQGLDHGPDGPQDSSVVNPPAPAEEEIPQFEPNYDPKVQDTAPAVSVNVSVNDALPGPRICTLADCGRNCVHTHDGVTYIGWTGKSTIPPYCADENCAVSGQHYHEQNGEVVHCYNTAPAEIPVCPVEGCTTWGYHAHDGDTYRCNGGHCGGVCDGSCNPWSASSSASGAGGHHGESHHSGHH